MSSSVLWMESQFNKKLIDISLNNDTAATQWNLNNQKNQKKKSPIFVQKRSCDYIVIDFSVYEKNNKNSCRISHRTTHFLFEF